MRSIVVEERRPPLRFGGFTLNLDQHALFCNGERVRITEKPLETLIFLIENRGRVVEKQELFDSVWKGTFVTDDTLVHAVREIRRNLGDDKDNPRFIQTVPRQGYRFIGEVFIESDSEESRTDQIVFASFTDPRFMEEAPPAKGKPALGSHKWSWLALAGFVAILSTAFAYSYFRRTPLTARYETQKQITSGEFSAGKPSFSPDGKYILCVWSSAESRGFGNIFVLSVADGRSNPITKEANPSGDLPVFTADSNNVVYSRYRSGSNGDRMPDLYIVPSSGVTNPHLFIAEAAGAGFSPDGRSVAYTKHLPSGTSLWLSPTNDLQQHVEIASEGFTPRFSPDGKWLSYTTSNPEKGLGDLWVTDTATFTEHRNLTNEPQQLYGLTWTADSNAIIFSSKRSGIHMLWQISLGESEIEPLMPTFGGYAIAPSVSPDGKTLIFQYGRIAKNVLLAKLSGEQPEELTNEEIHEWVRFSPSGKQIASIVQRHDFGKDLSIIELGEVSERKSRRFALGDGNPESLSWLDEKRLVYLAYDVVINQTRAVVIDTGNGMPTPLTRPFNGMAEWLAVNPDGTKAAVIIGDADERQRILVRDLETQAERTIAEGGEYAGLRWLADGSALSWSGPDRSADPASSGIWLWSTRDAVVSRAAIDGFSPVWSRDGGSVFFAKMNGLWEANQGKEVAIRDWPDNVTYFDVANEQVAFIQAKEIVKAQLYSVELSK